MVAPKISRGLRVLPSSSANKATNVVVGEEKDELLREISQIEQGWRDPRWKGTKRTYSGKSCSTLCL